MIRIGIVGCGAIARHAHLPAWRDTPNVEVVALCDRDAAAMAALAKRHGLACRTHASLAEMLAAGGIDALDICTPGHLHYEHACAGLRAGCHVLVEKPPVMSVAQAESLLQLAAAADRKVGAIFNFRYYDILQEARQAVDAGLLGRITKIHVVHHGNNIYGESPFLWNERESRYLLYDFGIHFLDAMIFLAGPVQRVVHVWARESPYTGETTDLTVQLEFASGAVGSFEITADFTLHSSHLTHINVYGTGMDMFVRKFPPSVRLVAGIHNPLEGLWSECRAVAGIARRLLSGRFLRWRNVSHARVFQLFAGWLEGRGDYPMKLADCMPTIRLLEDIRARIPAYADPIAHPAENGNPPP
jgi:predicted dehydrogenase